MMGCCWRVYIGDIDVLVTDSKFIGQICHQYNLHRPVNNMPNYACRRLTSGPELHYMNLLECRWKDSI